MVSKEEKRAAGSRLAELRQRYGLSQSAASSLLQIPLSTWQHWEQGASGMPDYLYRLISHELSRIARKRKPGRE